MRLRLAAVAAFTDAAPTMPAVRDPTNVRRVRPQGLEGAMGTVNRSRAPGATLDRGTAGCGRLLQDHYCRTTVLFDGTTTE
jgi:hypothetical protein